MTFEIGSLKVDNKALILTRAGHHVPAPPKVVELLATLCAQSGSVVSKASLLSRLWPQSNADDTALWQVIYLARKVLAETGAGSIQTLPRRGYRLVAAAPPDRPRRQGRRPRLAAAAFLALAVVIAILGVALRLKRVDPLAPHALQAYNLGTYYLRLRTAESASRAEAEFESVVRSAPQNALGYAGLSQAYVLEAIERSGRRNEFASRAATTGNLALRLDSHSSVAQTAVTAAADIRSTSSNGSLQQRTEPSIDRGFQRAVAFDPNDATARMYYGQFLLQAGETNKALVQLQRAVDLDPTLSYANVLLAEAALSHRDALAAAHYAIEGLGFGTSDKVDALRTLGYSYAETGRRQSALDAFRKLARYSPLLSEEGVAHVLHLRNRSGGMIRGLQPAEHLSV